MNRRQLLALSSMFPAAILSGCGSFGRTIHRVRFRLKLYAIVDGVERIGSSVIRCDWVDAGPLSQTGRYHAKVYGDAIVIDLGENRILVGILGYVYGHAGKGRFQYSAAGFGINAGVILSMIPDGPLEFEQIIARLKAQKNIEHDLTKDAWPLLVYFPDVRNYKSARFEDVDDLSSDLGSGHEITRFTLTVTDDPVTDNIAKQLPWLGQVPNRHAIAGLRTMPDFPPDAPAYRQLDLSNFKADGDARL